MARILLI